MTTYIREGGSTRKCEGLFADRAAEQLCEKFPKKYRAVYRDDKILIVEVLT